jgi:hypothetical protein
MIARCAQCRETFSTDKYGRQTCPLCGAEVYVARPGETPPPSASPSPEGAGLPPIPGEPPPPPPPGGGPPQDQRTPFEEKGFAGYFETVKLALFEPGKLFERMRVDDAKGALLFGWVTLTVPTIIGLLLTQALFPTDLSQLERFDIKVPPELRELMKDSLRSTIGSLIATPIVALVWVYLVAGVVHLMLLLLSQNKRGFNATFRAVCFASAPDVFSAVPQCGSIVAFFWMIGLTIFGLSHTQRIPGGSAAAAVLAPIALVCCTCCACAFMFGAAILAALGAAQ